MEIKTIEEKVEEKRKLMEQIDKAYNMTMDLYKVVVDNYTTLYSDNKAKVESQHMNGISQILDKLNNLIKTKKEIQNEISSLLDLENEDVNKNQAQIGKAFNKNDMMTLIKDGTKG